MTTDEAGYETLQGLASSRISSSLYNERTYLRSQAFLIHSLRAISETEHVNGRGTEGMEDILRWLYLAQEGPNLLDQTLYAGNAILARGEAGDSIASNEEHALPTISKGACVPLRRAMSTLMDLKTT